MQGEGIISGVAPTLTLPLRGRELLMGGDFWVYGVLVDLCRGYLVNFGLLQGLPVGGLLEGVGGS